MAGVSSGPTSSMMASAMASNSHRSPFRAIQRTNQLRPGGQIQVLEFVDLFIVFFLRACFEAFVVIAFGDLVLVLIGPARFHRFAAAPPSAPAPIIRLFLHRSLWLV